ncbi:MAG: PIG-L family deacetylase [Mycobacterium sp.]
MSNTARFAECPLSGGGTSIGQWLAGERRPELSLAACPALVVVAPHPDDETLGVGGLIASLADRGVDVTVVSVSDGGAAYPDIPELDRMRLESTRRAELDCAAAVLGVRQVIRLEMPDGQLAEHEELLAQRLAEVLAAAPLGVWCAATWRGDGHPDHEAVGRAAAVASAISGVPLVEYPVWMWHWSTPGDPAVPWRRALSVPLDRRASIRKHNAAKCFRSQFEAPAPDVEPVLPPFVMRRILAVGEVLFG